MSLSDNRQYAPATQRNREFIRNVLREVLPDTGTILEISSGTGEHAVFFAPAFYPRWWIPSDPNPMARKSIMAWREDCPTNNLCLPVALDACESPWLVEQADFSAIDLQRHPITSIINVNMIHIAPWSACLGLMAGAGRILPTEGILYLYGPFKQQGQHTAPSNAAFDESLRVRNPEWGVRDLEEVIAVAEAENLSFVKTVEMPANNLSVIFSKI